MKRKMKKWLVVISGILLLGSNSMGTVAHAQENGKWVETEYQELTGDNVAYGIYDVTGNPNVRAPILTNCSLGISVDSEGVHISITTGATEDASKLGAKEIMVEYKGSDGKWHDMTPGDHASSYRENSDNYVGSYIFTPAEKGVYYRASCVHYAYLSDGYHAISNLTKGVRY